MAEPILRLSTTSRPQGSPVEIDGQTYELYTTFDHLTPEQEARLRWVVRVYERLSEELASCLDEERGVELSKRLAALEIELLELMSTIPRDVLTKLPLSSRNELVALMGKEVVGGRGKSIPTPNT